MRRLPLLLALILSFTFTGNRAAAQQSSAPPAPSAPADITKLFDYDAKLPLDIKENRVYTRPGGIRIIDLTYASPVQGRVTAFLVLPEGKGPFAGILFGHWGPGNRTEFLSESELYARAGAVSLLIDYPWTRPAEWRRPIPNYAKPEVDLPIYAQAVVDLRRGFDLLVARADVDAKRIAYVGHSYGAQWGAILTAIDRRMKTSILVGGVPTAASVWLHDMTEYSAEEKEQATRYVAVFEPFDAIHFIPRSTGIPVLFQFANFEPHFDRKDMDEYFQAAGEPKDEKWYDTGHELMNMHVVLDRGRWLREQIGIEPIAPLMEQALKNEK